MAKASWIWRESAEVLAVIGVVSSLIFVAFEIRQNTQVSRAASVQAMADASIQVGLAMAADEPTTALMTKVLIDGAVPADFTPEENMKLRLLYVAALRANESRYRQTELGLLENAQDWLGGAAGIYRTAYFAERWPVYRSVLAEDFADYVESRYDLHSE